MRTFVMLLVLALLAIAVVPVCADQTLLTNRSDYLTVPNGNILGDKSLDVSVGSTGPSFGVGGGNTDIFAVGFGLKSFEATVNGSLDDFDMNDMAVSFKYQIDPGLIKTKGFGKNTRAAIFVDNLGHGQTGMPGIAVTTAIDKYLDLSVSGWYNDGCAGGAALQWFPAKWLAPTVEYSSDTRWAFGADLNYKDLYARVVYLDDTAGWYTAIGHTFKW